MNSSKLLLLFLITLFGCLGQFASDIYSPSVPAIAHYFAVNINLVQWSMALYLFGLSGSLLIYGPVSEQIGRKKTLVIGITIFCIGSLISLLAPNIQTLLIGRLCQGIGAGASTCMWRSVFRDVFSGEQLAKYSSYLTMVVVFITPAAPAVGGYLQHLFGWHASFVFLLGYALITLVAVLGLLQETHTKDLRQTHTLKTSLQAYAKLFRHRVFTGTTIAVFITYGAMFAWFITSPALLIHHLGISPVEYGWLNFAIGAIAYLAGGRLNALLVTRYGMAKMLRFGWGMNALAGIFLLITQIFFGMTVWGLSSSVLIFFFGTAFIWSNAFATAFTPIGKSSGFAAALYSFMQISGGAVLGALIAHLPDHNAYPLAMSFIVTAFLAWSIYELAVQPKMRIIQNNADHA